VLLAKASIGQAARTVVLLAHPITPQRRLQQIQPQKWLSKLQKNNCQKKRFLYPRTNAFFKALAHELSGLQSAAFEKTSRRLCHGQATNGEGGMRERGRAARLVWSVCGTTIRMCREIM